METNKLKALRSLKNNMPVANQQVAQQQQNANNFLLGRSIRQAPVTGNGQQVAQQAGAQMATQAGQQQVQQSQVQAQQVGQINQAAQSAMNNQLVDQQRTEQRNISNKLFEGQQRLAAISEKGKQEIFDSRMELKENATQLKYLNERSLMDFKVLQGVSQEQLADYRQEVSQANSRKIQLMKAQYDAAVQEMKQEYSKFSQEKRNEAQLALAKYEQAIKQEEQRLVDEANNGIAGPLFGAIGTVIGGIYGGPAGAAAGSSIGGGIGGFLDGAMDDASGVNERREVEIG